MGVFRLLQDNEPVIEVICKNCRRVEREPGHILKYCRQALQIEGWIFGRKGKVLCPACAVRSRREAAIRANIVIKNKKKEGKPFERTRRTLRNGIKVQTLNGTLHAVRVLSVPDGYKGGWEVGERHRLTENGKGGAFGKDYDLIDEDKIKEAK